MTKPSTFLIVDDDRSYCSALASALQRRGHQAFVAHNGEGAIEEAQLWKPSRAIVDLRMPGKSGLETVMALREVLPDLAMVVLTGYGSIATAVEAIKLGALHYLTKPVTTDEIINAFEHPQASLVTPPLKERVQSLEELEWEHLNQVLTDAGGNISEAARRLNMHRRTLQRKLARGLRNDETEKDD